ncbi:MAG: bifunctional riboflavin kinase/FAD synthetase [Mariprofundaceae bacterium]
MKVFRSWDDAKAFSDAKGGAVTIGNFDGVHLGHQQVLAELIGHALAVSGPSIVVTFEPHPRAVLFPDESPRRLCHLHERLELLRNAGVDVVLLLAFNKELAGWSADRFMQTLHDTFSFKHIHVGYDFAFGHDRTGHSDDLRKLGDEKSFTVSEAAAFEMFDAVVSSSRIRSAIEAADFDLAKTLLGRPYSVSGHVMHGEKRGRKIGFPTANLDVADLSHPPTGIYAVRAHHKTAIWNSAAYLGYRPTFDGRTLILEAHILDESPDLYNDRLEVEFVKRIREDRAFTGPDDLASQIFKDCKAARKILTE